MTFVYDIIFLLIALVHLPLYILRRKFHAGFIRRLGFIPRRARFDRPVWVHAVSVGEAGAARELVRELRERLGDKQFVISTVTATGHRIVRQYARKEDFVTYLPFDISFILKKVLRKVSPCVFVIVETELWPNLINTLAAMRIPTVVVNGRISDRSFRGYRIAGRLLKPLVRKLTAIMAQSEQDAQRFLALGALPERVHIAGNMKFDAVRQLEAGADYPALRRRLGLDTGDLLWVAGSTHRGEEEMIMRVYNDLHGRFCGLRLLLAPRHPERCEQVEQAVRAYHFDAVRTSSIEPPQLRSFSRRTVFLLDTVGELVHYYGAGDFVFVGGSLVKKGGHNILEPAALAKPVFFGPHTGNFRDIADMFLQRQAARCVRNEEELSEQLQVLLDDPAAGREVGQRAYRLVHENTGSIKRMNDRIEILCTSAT